jgi:hypothetical protein
MIFSGTASGPIPSFRLRNDSLIGSVHLPLVRKQNTNGLQVPGNPWKQRASGHFMF